jgi:hypothetical protein
MSDSPITGKKRAADEVTGTPSAEEEAAKFPKANSTEDRRIIAGKTTAPAPNPIVAPAFSLNKPAFSLGTATFGGAGASTFGGLGAATFGGGGFAKFGSGSTGFGGATFGGETTKDDSTGGTGGFGGAAAKSTSDEISVDEHTGLDNTHSVGHMLLEWYHCDLRKTDEGSEKEEFHIIQIIQNKEGTKFYTFRRWGTAGETGEKELEGPDGTLDSAKTKFCELFEEQTGHPWAQRHMHDPKAGKFVWSKPAVSKLETGLDYKAPDADAKKCEFEGTQESNGEEGEDVLMDVQCKLYTLDTVLKEYKDKGRGTLKLLAPRVKTEGSFARLVMRRVKTLDVNLNCQLRAHCTVDTQGRKSMSFGTVADDGPQVYAIRFDDVTECTMMTQRVRENIPAKTPGGGGGAAAAAPAAAPAATAAADGADATAEEEL